MPAEGYNMIFESLAKFIMKHAKTVLLVWIVVLLASAYPAMHAGEKLSYGTESMGSSTTESIDGLVIIGEHFQSQTDSESMQMILIVYDNADDESLTKLTDGLTAIPSSDDKVSSVIEASTVEKDPTHHMKLYAATYKTGISADDISADTGNLRSLVGNAAKAAFDGKNVDYDTYVTGTPAISYDASEAMGQDMARVDPISIFLIIVLIGLFFRSFVTSAAPPITIGVAFALALCALFFVGSLLDIYYIVEMLLIVSMLGAGCDYCIFILSRYREERRRGLEHMDACQAAITWAGESVFTSGMAVMIGFGAMTVCEFRLISSMGIGLAIGILFALLAALTLMSSLLVLLGDKLFWPSGSCGEKLEKGYLKKMGEIAKKYFDISTRASIKYAKVIVIATILFTVPMVYVYTTSEDSYDMIGSMMTGESQEGMIVMTDYAGGGAIMPNYAVVETSAPIAYVSYLDPETKKLGLLTWTPNTDYLNSVRADLTTITTKSKALDNVTEAYVSMIEGNQGAMAITWQVIVYTATHDPATPIDPSTDIVVVLNGLPDYLAAKGMPLPASAAAMLEKVTPLFGPELRAAITGSPTGNIPFSDPMVAKIMDWLLFVQTGTLGLTDNAETGMAEANYVKITMATKEQAMSDKSIDTVGEFRSIVRDTVSSSQVLATSWITGTAAVMVEIKDIVDPEFMKIEITAIVLIIILLFLVLKSYITPIRSVLTIFMSVIWTVAITHLLFGNLLGQGVLWILPIILLVVCLGLGMDYDILLTTRIREYRFDKGMDEDEAIHQAVLHSGSVITLCGLIMGGTFGTLMLSNTVMLQQMGFALCFAILVDALVVRTYIVPAMMHLLGRWNWVGPDFLQQPGGIGRGIAAVAGLAAAALMGICLMFSLILSDMPADLADIVALTSYSGNTDLLMRVGFGLGGVLLLIFGGLMVRTNKDVYAKCAGVVFAVSAVLMIVSLFADFSGVSYARNDMWTVAFGASIVASLLYMGYLATKNHPVGMGLMAIVLLAIVGATVAGMFTFSFGLAIATVFAVAVIGFCEYAELK